MGILFPSPPYMLRPFHNLSISHASRARVALRSAELGTSEVGRADEEGLRARGRLDSTFDGDTLDPWTAPVEEPDFL